MGKTRKLVPAALYSEVAEYTSLLRSLKTNSALDISSHLARSQTQPSAWQFPGEQEPERCVTEATGGALSLDPAAGSSTQVAGSNAIGAKSTKARDTWTR